MICQAPQKPRDYYQIMQIDGMLTLLSIRKKEQWKSNLTQVAIFKYWGRRSKMLCHVAHGVGRSPPQRNISLPLHGY
jgi:hypothetical protein